MSEIVMTDMKRCPSIGLATFFNECDNLKAIILSCTKGRGRGWIVELSGSKESTVASAPMKQALPVMEASRNCYSCRS